MLSNNLILNELSFDFQVKNQFYRFPLIWGTVFFLHRKVTNLSVFAQQTIDFTDVPVSVAIVVQYTCFKNGSPLFDCQLIQIIECSFFILPDLDYLPIDPQRVHNAN